MLSERFDANCDAISRRPPGVMPTPVVRRLTPQIRRQSLVKPLPPDDFRAVRSVLEPDDFAHTDSGPERPPTDLIAEETRRHLVILPDDVSIRTSNHHGTELTLLSDLAAGWTEAIGDEQDMIGVAMVEVMMEFDASIHNLLVGFYPQAIGCLRGILEGMMAGAYCHLTVLCQFWW